MNSNALEGRKESEFVNFLKLRAGYGTSASFPTGYPIASTLSLDTQAFNTDEGLDIVTNTTSRSLGNPDLKPERLDELEFGLEGSFLDNRITVDFSVYTRTTNNLVVERPLDPSTGFDDTQTNIGEIKNDGIELDLTLDLVRNEGDGFNWSTNFNWSTSEAIVTDLGLDTDNVIYAGFTNLGNAAIAGESLGTMIGSAIARDDNGNFKVNGSGSYVIQNGINIIGDANPDFTGGFTINANAYGFDFSAAFNFSVGNDVYNADKVEFSTARSTQQYRNLSSIMADGNRWTNLDPASGQLVTDPTQLAALNANTTMWSPYMSRYIFSDWAVEDGSFLRLNNITIGYTLPEIIISKLGVSKLRFYATANNVFTITNYSGSDPEVSTRRKSPFTPAVDSSTYTRSRQIVFGVNFNF